MLSYADPKWAALTIDTRTFRTKPPEQQEAQLGGHAANFPHRTAIRSIWDGRYRFSRYFSPMQFNTPRTMEELVAKNDLEVYDLQADPDEMTNLALDPKKNGDLILTLNQATNDRIADEVGNDDGSFLPIRDGKWKFPPASEDRSMNGDRRLSAPLQRDVTEQPSWRGRGRDDGTAARPAPRTAPAPSSAGSRR